MSGRPASPLRGGVYSLAGVRDFYDQTSTRWGPNNGPLLNARQYVVKLVPAGSRSAAS
jgi:hypothetical protein